MAQPAFSRNVLTLALGMALGSTGTAMIAFAGGIIGTSLAPDPTLATLPVALMIIGNATATIPASLLMRRIGRRAGFMTGAGLGMLGALTAVFAIAGQQFPLFCAATLILGANNAFIQQYRFAASESAAPEAGGRAISFVLLGGIAGGLFGPEIGKRTVGLLPYGEYSASFAALIGVYFLVLLLMSSLRRVNVQAGPAKGEERPLKALLRVPQFPLAILSGVVAYGVMTLLMTATPISMHVIEGHTLDQTGWVIQSHIVAMYLPSLFTGFILARISPMRLLGLGIAVLLASVALALAGRALVNYWTSLVLLGVGWNFLFVAGTVLLTQVYRPAERFKAQALNDFSVFGMQALASLSAGSLIHTAGWTTLASLTIPVMLLMALAAFLVHRRSLQARPPATAAG